MVRAACLHPDNEWVFFGAASDNLDMVHFFGTQGDFRMRNALTCIADNKVLLKFSIYFFTHLNPFSYQHIFDYAGPLFSLCLPLSCHLNSRWLQAPPEIALNSSTTPFRFERRSAFHLRPMFSIPGLPLHNTSHVMLCRQSIGIPTVHGSLDGHTDVDRTGMVKLTSCGLESSNRQKGWFFANSDIHVDFKRINRGQEVVKGVMES